MLRPNPDVRSGSGFRLLESHLEGKLLKRRKIVNPKPTFQQASTTGHRR
jgi:hypothetical protein